MESNVLTRRGALLGLAWLFACGTSKKVVTPMSDGRVKTYEQYLSAWSAITDDERAERLRGSLSPNVIFLNPTQTRRGLAEVAGQCAVFQKRTPGGSFVADEMLAFESHGIVKWRLLDAQGKPGAFDMYGFDYGYDVVEFNAEGRIERILMFVHMKGASLEIARPLADSDDTVRDDCPCTVPELDHACLRTFEILEPVTTGGRLESALPHTTPSFPIARPFRLGCADRGRARRR